MTSKSFIPVSYTHLDVYKRQEENLDPADITEEERNLADTVIRLLQDEKLLQSYRQTAARRAGDFTYEKYLEQFLKLAEE